MIRRLPSNDKQRLINLIWLLYRAPATARDAAIGQLEATLHQTSLSSVQLLHKVESAIADLQKSVEAAEQNDHEK